MTESVDKKRTFLVLRARKFTRRLNFFIKFRKPWRNMRFEHATCVLILELIHKTSWNPLYGWTQPLLVKSKRETFLNCQLESDWSLGHSPSITTLINHTNNINSLCLQNTRKWASRGAAVSRKGYPLKLPLRLTYDDMSHEACHLNMKLSIGNVLKGQ